MATSNLIEIIGPNGDVRFHELNARVGVSNIGRHPDNDIVIASPELAEFHAVLDHRTRPYQLMLLSPGGNPRLGGQPISSQQPIALKPWDSLELDGHTLIVLEGGSGGQSQATAPHAAAAPAPAAGGGGGAAIGGALGTLAGAFGVKLPALPAAPKVPGLPPRSGAAPARDATDEAGAGGSGALEYSQFAAMPADHHDEVVLVETSAHEWTVDCGQPAVCQLTIINGGDVVAAFDVRVDGLPPEWVSIKPGSLNLNEGERGAVSMTIIAPRVSGSLAGPHAFAIAVTSPNHPGRESVTGAMLTLNPFYDYDVSDLSPRQLTTTWGKRTAAAALSVTNTGNSPVAYVVEGSDEERACSFEFQTSGQTSRRAKQTHLTVGPTESAQVDVFATPNKRHLVALRSHLFMLTMTTTPQAPGQMARSALAQLTAKPLIGPGLLALMLLLLALITVLIFRPDIYSFTASQTVVEPGQDLILTWQAKPFSELKLKVDNDITSVGSGDGQKTLKPRDTQLYRLTAENWLTRLIPWLPVPVKEVQVLVTSVPPSIRKFATDRSPLVAGETATVYWEVTSADELQLVTNGAPETIPADQRAAGQRKFPLTASTTFQLVAKNYYGRDEKNFSVDVQQPTGTPVPPPVIVRFDASPTVITAGQEIKLDWEVTGADRVQIGNDAFPPKGSLGLKPDKNQAIVLRAFNGTKEVNQQRNIVVFPAPTPTAVPLAPRIEFFTVTPPEFVIGSLDASNIQLAWSIQGDITNVEITNPDLGKVSNLARSGTLQVAAAKTTLYVITAYNKDQVASTQVALKGLDPTATPPPTPTPVPPPVINYYLAQSGESPARPEEVTLVNDSTLGPNTTKYEVLARAQVKLSWKSDAPQVTLQGAGQPNEGTLNIVARVDDERYHLVATGPGGTADRFIIIKLRARPTPPPPTNFAGVNSAAPPLNLSWQYASQQQSSITGFRIYRAAVPGGSFGMVADEGTLKPSSTSYQDSTVKSTCGQAYYIVAVYLNVKGDSVETSPSQTSWYSAPCR